MWVAKGFVGSIGREMREIIRLYTMYETVKKQPKKTFDV